MTGISCFPLSVQTQSSQSAGYGEYGYGRSVDLELVGDLIAGMTNAAGKLASLFEQAAKAGVAAKKAELKNAQETLLEQQKLALARNPKTAPAILVELSRDVNSAVRNEVALNLSAPDFLLRKLAADSDTFIASQARTRLLLPALH